MGQYHPKGSISWESLLESTPRTKRVRKSARRRRLAMASLERARAELERQIIEREREPRGFADAVMALARSAPTDSACPP